MPAKYSPVKVFDAKLVYDVWMRLVGDEELYDAMLDGRHAEVARQRGMDDEEILILDDFAGQPGTRWHIDNLRFRCTTMVSRILKWHMPATIALLTGGNEDWLRDLTFEYISDQRWRDLGHHKRLAECQRFAKSVRLKIKKRRLTSDYLEEVLRYELAVIDLVQRAAQLGPDAWPARRDDATARPRLGPAVQLVELPVDLTAWLNKPEGKPVPASADPTTALVWIPGPSEAHRMVALAAADRALLEACRGDKTVPELAAASPAAEATLKRWLAERVLAA